MIIIDKKVIDADVMDIVLRLKEYILNRDNKIIIKDVKDGPDNVMITCPYHKHGDERRPSCGISKIDKGDTPAGMVHCFTCGKKLFIDKLISNCLGYEDDGLEGRQWLLENFDVSFNRKLDVKLQRQMRHLDKIEEAYNIVQEIQLQQYRYYHPYMYKRGLTNEIIEKYDIGYDKYNNMITFPVRDIQGRCLFLAKRSVNGKMFVLPSNKNKPLYGVYELDYNKTDIYIVESFFNALTLAKWGYNAVALMGTGSNYQYELINNLPFRKIIICLDGDFAGRMGTKKMLSAIKNEKLVYYYEMPEGKDVNDLTEETFKTLEIYRR